MQTVDFKNRSAAAGLINNWVNTLTAGNIHTIVNPGDCKQYNYHIPLIKLTIWRIALGFEDSR